MRRKLNFGFLAIILLLWAICVYTVVSSMEVRRIGSVLKDEIVPGSIEMANIRFEASEIKGFTLSYILRGDIDIGNKTIKNVLFESNADLNKTAQRHFKEGYYVREEREDAEKIKELVKKLTSVSVEIVTMKDRGVEKDKLFKIMVKEFHPVFIELRDKANKHAQMHAERMEKAETEVYNKYNVQIGSVAILGIAATLLAVFVGLMVDRNFARYILQRNLAEEKILHMANHDTLTGLPSLRLARDRILLATRQASRNKTTAAVMFIDLDGFKKINDNFGHDAGDILLTEVARRLLSCVREVDTVARIGGDEFLLIASDLSDKDDAAKIAGKVVKRVAEPFAYNGDQLNVGVSIGIALCPGNGKEAEILIRKADDAMYVAKESGNRFVFSDAVG